MNDTSIFSPSPCEPCQGGPIHTPEGDCGLGIDVPPAPGGCVRPRFFDGMFLTRDDLDTQLGYLRAKLRLHNRAAGSGVVWGLGVQLDREHVVVAPGYGVDTCGNDLTVACDYRTPARLLLTDRDVCRDRGERRCYSLLLEYVECPEDPRPVHTDGCGPTAPGCEVSRIRETVRLRLVPPRPTPTSPLVELLTKLESMTGAGLTKVPVRLVDRETPEVDAPDSVAVPFTVVTTLGSSTELQPSRSNTVQDTIESVNASGYFALRLRPHPGLTTLSGTVRTDDGTAVATLGSNGANWNTMIGKAGSYTFTVEWSARTDAELRGVTTIHVVVRGGEVVEGIVRDPTDTEVYVWFPDGHDLSLGDTVQVERPETGNTWSMPVAEIGDDGAVVLSRGPDQVVEQGAAVRYNRDYNLDTIVAPTRIRMRRPLSNRPCCDGGCCSEHDRPSLEDRLQVLLVALLYGRLVQQHAALSISDRSETLDSLAVKMRTLLDVRHERAAQVEQVLSALYREWCRAAIYQGPERHDPDGVVVGCATVRNGAICSIDPVDGRRWVVHQPLIDHWSLQFGLDPLDTQVTALFQRLCCLADLPGFGDLLGDRPIREEEIRERAHRDMIASSDMVTPFAMVAPSGMSEYSRPIKDPSSAMLARLAQMGSLDLPTIAMIVDDLFCGRQKVPQVHYSPERADALVASAHADLGPRDLPNMDLREVSREITHSVLDNISAAVMVSEDSPVGLLLEDAGIVSLEAAIGIDPGVLRDAGSRLATEEQVDAAVETARKTAALVSQVVARSIRDATGLSDPEELQDSEMAASVADTIGAKLADEGIEVDREAIMGAITRRSG